MPWSYEECFEKGLLRRVPPSKEKAVRSFEKSTLWLKEASTTFESKAFNSAVSAAYLAMFHAARALLFAEGIREKSHFCVARFLEFFVKNGDLEQRWVDLLDHCREMRHGEQYDLGFSAGREDGREALKASKVFLERIKKLMDKLGIVS